MIDDSRRQAAIAEVAIALCKLDGLDTTKGLPAGTREVGVMDDGKPLTIAFVDPAWKAREAEASRLVAAIEALGLLR